jgi:hypothetical protein
VHVVKPSRSVVIRRARAPRIHDEPDGEPHIGCWRAQQDLREACPFWPGTSVQIKSLELRTGAVLTLWRVMEVSQGVLPSWPGGAPSPRVVIPRGRGSAPANLDSCAWPGEAGRFPCRVTSKRICLFACDAFRERLNCVSLRPSAPQPRQPEPQLSWRPRRPLKHLNNLW